MVPDQRRAIDPNPDLHAPRRRARLKRRNAAAEAADVNSVRAAATGLTIRSAALRKVARHVRDRTHSL
jgi:hypothetical protein